MLENSLTLCTYFFVIVNSRPANRDSLMELNLRSTSCNIISAFSQSSEFLRFEYFGVLLFVLSRRKLSCEQFSFPSSTTFTSPSSGGLVRDDGLDCLPKFVSALRTN